MKGVEVHYQFGNFLNKAVILFNQVIQIVDLAYLNNAQQTCKHQEYSLTAPQ
jgi:hypothetical protein